MTVGEVCRKTMSRSAFSYKAKVRDCSAIRLRIREITQTRVHYGCERVLVMLRREGWRDNHKRVHRIYKEKACRCGIVGRGVAAAADGGNRSKWPRRPIGCGAWTSSVMRYSMAVASGCCRCWITSTHECLDIVVDQSLRAEDVAGAVTRLVTRRGTPTDNAMVESFNGRLRQECLNERSKIKAWRRFYDEERPPQCAGMENPCGIRPRTRVASESAGAEKGRNVYRLMALLSGVGHGDTRARACGSAKEGAPHFQGSRKGV